ncbi:MAG: thiamine phosphate synthase [Candidatus Omnitrophota bacterium]
MKSKKKLLENSRLYVILDKDVLGNNFLFDTAKQLRDSEVKIVQFRDKQSPKADILKAAFKLRKIIQNSKAIFIVNDHLDIAKIADTDGIHLGQDDIPIEMARKILGRNKIIGISCHSLKQALTAQRKGADYIGIGPIFPTSTKPEYKTVGLSLITKIKRRIKIPFFAIGGINETNLNEVLSSGAKRIAVCRAVCQAKNIHKIVKLLNC